MEQSNNSGNGNAGNAPDSGQLIIAKEVLPEFLFVIPISHRPIFPGMMIPIVLTGDFMIDTANRILEADAKIGGVVLARELHEGAPKSDDMYTVGVAVKVLRVTPIDEKTIQMMINALGRFTLKKVVQDSPRSFSGRLSTISRRIIPGPR